MTTADYTATIDILLSGANGQYTRCADCQQMLLTGNRINQMEEAAVNAGAWHCHFCRPRPDYYQAVDNYIDCEVEIMRLPRMRPEQKRREQEFHATQLRNAYRQIVRGRDDADILAFTDLKREQVLTLRIIHNEFTLR